MATDGTAQRAQQTVLMTAMTAALVKAWPLYVPGDSRSVDRWIAAVYALVNRFGRASSSSAATFYERARADATLGRYRAVVAPAVPEQAVQSAMRWALTLTPSAVELAADGAATKLALDAGRVTLISNITADKKATAWVRVARPGACSFCRLLAIRGPVYRSETTAGFEAHDHCRCFPSPIFAGQKYQAPANVLEWRRQYEESTAGLSGAAARNAFRRAVEHRTPTP